MTLGACGGSGSGSGKSGAESAALTFSQKGKCSSLTANARKQLSGETDQAKCQKILDQGTKPPAFHISSTSVSGNTATLAATAAGKGLTIQEVLKGGHWLIDSVSSGATASSSAATDTTATTATTTPPTGAAGGTAPNAETTATATCLTSKSKKVKGSQYAGKPAIVARLLSGNVVAIVLYGPAGGALEGERAVRRSHPNFAAYSSPDGKILIFYSHKPNPTDFATGNTCQMQASAAG